MSDLKPCPFCGGTPKLGHRETTVWLTSYVECESCGARTYEFTISTEHSSDEWAAEAWNRRVSDDCNKKY